MAPPLEISIPTTTTRSTSPPYTLYNITLRLPLRTFIVQKRYSDFADLDKNLKAQFGENTPAPLPSKGWKLPILGMGTGINPAKVEERRLGLEAYLRAIAESGDGRWRNCSAWRQFLNLPSASTTSSSSRSEAHSAITGVASTQGGGANLDAGSWLDVHREAKQCLHDARLWLGKRDAASTSKAEHEAGAGAKKCLVKAGGLIIVLEEGLEALGKSKSLGDGEMRRRKDLVGQLRGEKEGLEKLNVSLAVKGNLTGSSSTSTLQQNNAETASAKSSLFSAANNGPQRKGRVLGAPQETERTRELDNQGVLQLQQQIMQEQDVDVQELGKIIRRQREMAVGIHEEIEVQNEMLGRLDGDVDRVQGKVDVAKKRAGRIK